MIYSKHDTPIQQRPNDEDVSMYWLLEETLVYRLEYVILIICYYTGT